LARIHVAFPQQSSASSIRMLQAHVSMLMLLAKNHMANPKSSQRKHKKKKTQKNKRVSWISTKEHNKTNKNNNKCLLTEDSSTKIDGNFFSVAITTPFAATTPKKII
jgi:hypothetical protein